MNQRTLTALQVLGQVKHARRDHANKVWLIRESARSDRESKARMEFITVLMIVVFGALVGLALFDWTQDMEWARALVALVYQVGPL